MSDVQRWARPVDGGWEEIKGAFTIQDGGSNEVWRDPNDPAAGTVTVTYDLPFSEDWIACATAAERTRYGIKALLAADEPLPGHRILGQTIVTSGGKPKLQWITEEVPLAERLPTLISAIDAERDARQAADFAYDFGETVAVDDMGEEIGAGVRSLQMRPEDRINWQALQSQAAIVPAEGRDAVVMPMRAEDNWNVQTTAAQVLAVTTAMFLRNAALLFHGGNLKTQARKAVEEGDRAAFEAVIVTEGWPA